MLSCIVRRAASGFIFCAAEINKSTRDQIFSEPTPRAFSSPVFLFQTLVSLLRFPPQIIGGQYLPLGIRADQIQSRQFFWEISFRIKSEIPRNKLLLPARSIYQFDFARFIAGQFMGRVDLPQELLCGQVPLNVFLPRQTRVLAPLVVLLVVHR